MFSFSFQVNFLQGKTLDLWSKSKPDKRSVAIFKISNRKYPASKLCLVLQANLILRSFLGPKFGFHYQRSRAGSKTWCDIRNRWPPKKSIPIHNLNFQTNIILPIFRAKLKALDTNRDRIENLMRGTLISIFVSVFLHLRFRSWWYVRVHFRGRENFSIRKETRPCFEDTFLSHKNLTS